MKRKIGLCVLLCISLLPMLFPQYGGMIGIDDVNGIPLLKSIGGICCIGCYLLGVWLPIRVKQKGILLYIGSIGMVVLKLYAMLMTGRYARYYTNGWDYIKYQFNHTFFMFWVGLFASMLLVVVVFHRITNDKIIAYKETST